MMMCCIIFLDLLLRHLDSSGYPECVTGLYSDAFVYHQNTGAASLLPCKKHGNLLLTSHLVYNVVTCVDKLARKSLCIRASFD